MDPKESSGEKVLIVDPNKKGRQIFIVYNSKIRDRNADYGGQEFVDKLVERTRDGLYVNEDMHLLGYRNLMNNKLEYVNKKDIVRIEIKS